MSNLKVGDRVRVSSGLMKFGKTGIVNFTGAAIGVALEDGSDVKFLRTNLTLLDPQPEPDKSQLCVRCGAPYLPSGKCSGPKCQGGRGENPWLQPEPEAKPTESRHCGCSEGQECPACNPALSVAAKPTVRALPADPNKCAHVGRCPRCHDTLVVPCAALEELRGLKGETQPATNPIVNPAHLAQIRENFEACESDCYRADIKTLIGWVELLRKEVSEVTTNRDHVVENLKKARREYDALGVKLAVMQDERDEARAALSLAAKALEAVKHVCRESKGKAWHEADTALSEPAIAAEVERIRNLESMLEQKLGEVHGLAGHVARLEESAAKHEATVRIISAQLGAVTGERNEERANATRHHQRELAAMHEAEGLRGRVRLLEAVAEAARKMRGRERSGYLNNALAALYAAKAGETPKVDQAQRNYKEDLDRIASAIYPNKAQFKYDPFTYSTDFMIEEIQKLRGEFARLTLLLNTPETEDFDKAVPLESAHQIERWTAEHDAGKSPEDWFWLVGYLAGKALSAGKSGDETKALHHCISTAAALRNWHSHIRSGRTEMRPGISEEQRIPDVLDQAREGSAK